MLAELSGYSYTYPGSNVAVLNGVDLRVGAGECHVITGPTGSGKSTLGLAIRGLLPDGGVVRGTARLAAEDSVGLVFQNPDTQLLCRSVGSEAAFGLENICIEPDAMEALVRDALMTVGLRAAMGADCRRLSMGQKYRLVMASHLAMRRRLIIIDEPTGQLDEDGIDRLCGIINRLKEYGVSFMILEHDAWAFAKTADAFWKLGPEEGIVRCEPETNANPLPARVAGCDGGTPVIHASGLSAVTAECKDLWSDADFTVSRGELVAVAGRNGSGKTTMLRCIMGLAEPAKGKLSVLGEGPSRLRESGKSGCLLQDPHAQLFEETVAEEVSFTLRRLGVPRGESMRRVEYALNACGITGLAGCSPHRLSYGQKRLVSLASVIAHGPELLLLDDPFSGLDGDKRCDIFALLERFASDNGAAVVWTTHRMDGAGFMPGKLLRIADGKVTEHSC